MLGYINHKSVVIMIYCDIIMLLHVQVEARRGAGTQSVTVIATGCGFNLTRGNKIFI